MSLQDPKYSKTLLMPRSAFEMGFMSKDNRCIYPQLTPVKWKPNEIKERMKNLGYDRDFTIPDNFRERYEQLKESNRLMNEIRRLQNESPDLRIKLVADGKEIGELPSLNDRVKKIRTDKENHTPSLSSVELQAHFRT